jgi:hypothetical protein
MNSSPLADEHPDWRSLDGHIFHLKLTANDAHLYFTLHNLEESNSFLLVVYFPAESVVVVGTEMPPEGGGSNLTPC